MQKLENQTRQNGELQSQYEKLRTDYETVAHRNSSMATEMKRLNEIVSKLKIELDLLKSSRCHDWIVRCRKEVDGLGHRIEHLKEGSDEIKVMVLFHQQSFSFSPYFLDLLSF